MRGRHALVSSVALALVALALRAIAWAGPDSRQAPMLDNCDGPSFSTRRSAPARAFGTVV